MITRRTLLNAAGAAVLAPALPRSASAQNFTRPLRFVVPFAPGGSSDILARLIGPKLAEAVGQPVIVENKPGGSGNIGADLVAKAEPDGTTMLITDVGGLATAPSLFRQLSFNVQRDLVPVTMILFAPYLFAVHPSVPAATVQELVAYARANPNRLNVGNSGVGAPNHLTAIVVARHYNITWGHVPYRGGAAAITAVVTNESNVIFNGATATQPFVVNRQLKGLAVSGDRRLDALPNLPTFKELEMPAVDSGTWQGILTSRGTPAPVVARLNQELRRIIALPDIAAKIRELGGEDKSGPPEAMAAWLGRAIEDWGRVVREAEIRLD